jgi:cation transport ATPase
MQVFTNTSESTPRLRRIFAHKLFIQGSPEQLSQATGKLLFLDRFIVRTTRMFAPWFLMASMVMLVMSMKWFVFLFFIPLFLLGYFWFTVQSLKDGALGMPLFIALAANALPWIPDSSAVVSSLALNFLALYTLAMLCNRLSWWWAERALLRNPALHQMFRNKQSPPKPATDHTEIVDAEVVE